MLEELGIVHIEILEITLAIYIKVQNKSEKTK
jgi:hypothetical protein